MPRVEARSVSKSIAGKRVLDRVTMTVEGGEVVALVGHNGAGKTTLLRILVGLEEPDEGRVVVEGRVGYMPELDYLPLFFTLRDLAVLHGVEPSRLVEALEDIAPGRGWGRLLDSRLAALSKGMRRLVGLALLLEGGFDVLVLDEPLSGIDWAARRRVLEALKAAASKGVAVLATGHAISDFIGRCSRILLMSEGRVTGVIDGEPRGYVLEVCTSRGCTRRELDAGVVSRLLSLLGIEGTLYELRVTPGCR